MIPVLVILALVILVSGPIAIGIALAQRGHVKGLRAEVRALREELRGRPEAQAGSTATAAPPAHAGSTEASAPVTPVVAAPPPSSPSGEGSYPLDLERMIGSQWLTWVGILAIFLGTAFFLAIDLTGPIAGVGQVLVGFLVGALFVGSGSAIARRRRILARGLLGGGVALLYLSAYAAHGFHQLVPAPVVYLFLAGVASVGAALAIREDAASIAILTLIGAFLTPSVLGTDEIRAEAILPYLVAVNLGTIAISLRRSWGVLPYLGLFGTLLTIATGWLAIVTTGTMGWIALAFTVLWIAYSAFPLRMRLTGPAAGTMRSGVIVIAACAYAVFVHYWVGLHAGELRGIALLVLALAYLIAGRVTRHRRPRLVPVYYHYSGIALAVVAVPVALDAHWTTTAWALMGAVLTEGAVRGRSRGHVWASLVVLGGAIFHTIAIDTFVFLREISEGARGGPGAEVIGAVLTAAALGFAGWRLRRSGIINRTLGDLLATLAPALLLWSITVETWGWFEARDRLAGDGRDYERAGLFAISWLWAAYAAILILAGFLTRYRPVRLLGVVVIALLVGKVMLLDLQELERGYRIASFAGVGVLLLAISLLYQRERR